MYIVEKKKKLARKQHLSTKNSYTRKIDEETHVLIFSNFLYFYLLNFSFQSRSSHVTIKNSILFFFSLVGLEAKQR